MTTFQAIVTSLVSVFTEIFPLSPSAHASFLQFFFGWPAAPEALLTAIYGGLLTALLLYLRHDLLSLCSSFLQIIVYRRKPMSIDERLPFFVLASLILPLLGWSMLHDSFAALSDDPLKLAAIFGATALPLWFLDYYTKKNKNFYDWNLLDAILLGLGGACFLVPGIGRTAGALMVSSLRNFSREGAAKFILYSAVPLVGGAWYWHFRHADLSTWNPYELSRLSFWVSYLVSLVGGLFAASAFLGSISRTPLRRYAIYRLLLAAAVVGVHFFRNR